MTFRNLVLFVPPSVGRDKVALWGFTRLRIAVIAGQNLPVLVHEEWTTRTRKPLLSNAGPTEMLHIILNDRFHDHRPARPGPPISGYEARLDGEDRRQAPMGRLILRSFPDPRDASIWSMTASANMCSPAGPRPTPIFCKMMRQTQFGHSFRRYDTLR